jgi:Ca2+-binding RTX toxin-like protein
VDDSDAGTADDDPSDLKTVIRDYVASNPTNPLFPLGDWQRADGEWDGERLFQAAKFVTEMEYQHLAFEEFARKVQPLVNLFGEGGTGYNTSINPSVRGEFAHAVYRFGHSMLTETVDRVGTGTNPPRSDLPLLTAFLNPPAFMPGTQTPDQAAGSIVRGMTRQVGNEIDEFVTDALRNELLGLPLDLPALNMARARETGTPTLNAARRSFFASSNNSALAPYESWADFQFSIRNPGSLVNFVAAYGTHATITGEDSVAGKRNAANALIYGVAGPDGDLATADDIPAASVPADSYEFLNSTGPYANDDIGVTMTGVDDIDLWMGGLAERQVVFGGLLGPTFNFVFEKQMEDLQNGDRFYYLSRTVSQNLLVQLEGNSFSELIQRNTDVSGLPADSFSRPDLVFDMAAQNASGAIVDDPDTTYNEIQLLTRMADGTIRYGKVPGAHTVFNGTAGNDKMWSGEGDDTIRGNNGNDRIQGGDGVDSLIGGLGNDVIQDLAGDDTLKGGDGNDVLSSGQGFGGDLNQGGRGNDFILGGNDITESFAGLGDDFVSAGDADDTVFGDEGDDWIEGGTGNFNLLQGDNGAPFQDDATGGHDILIGYGGEQDYDAEGGDDVMLGGPGIQRAEGMLGFDWFTHDQDPSPTGADSDMAFTGLLPPSVETNKDRFDLVESLSGGDKNDVLRGDDRVAADLADGHGLNAAGIERTDGLAALLPAGATSFTGGNILIGGAGSDEIEGRGGDDVIDGDAYLDVRISVRDAATGATEVEAVDTMAGVQARVVAGFPISRLRPVREILTPANGTAVDTAVFSGARAEYDITFGTGSVTVAHTRGLATDGTDTVRNAERLRFSDQTISGIVVVPTVTARGPADGATGVAATTNVTATFSEDVVGVNGARFTLRQGTTTTGTQVAGAVTYNTATLTATLNPNLNLAPNTVYTARLLAGITDTTGSALAPVTWSFTTAAAPNVAPTVTARAPAVNATAVAPTDNVTATFSEPVDGVSGTTFELRTPGGALVPAVVTRNGTTNQWILNPGANLAPDVRYTVTLTGGATAIRDLAGAPLVTASWSFLTGPRPVVTARTPALGATAVGRTSNVTATFGEPVRNLTGTTVTLRSGTAANGTLQAGAVTYNATTRTVTLNPNATLAANTQFTVRLSTGITDAAGNPLGATSWSFRTGA